MRRGSTQRRGADQDAAVLAKLMVLHAQEAVAHLPAVSSLNVCGDWYDIADVSADRLTAAVGEAVGRDLEAAAVMGMLRSALSATIRASEGPAYALETLERAPRPRSSTARATP